MTINEHASLPSPEGKFPDYPPLSNFRKIMDEVENNVQAPRPMIYFSALSAIAIAVQGLFDVRKPNGQCVPLSLMLCTIAASGDRKTTTDNVFSRTIREFQEARDSIYKWEFKGWEFQNDVISSKSKELLRVIGRLAAQGEPVEEEEAKLMKLSKSRPTKPRRFKALYEDSTSEALFFGLSQDLPSAGLTSTEGGILNGRAFNDLAKQNSLWSGDSISVERKSSESYRVDGARLTVSMLVQPSAFDNYIKRHGEMARGSGLWARFLVSRPISMQGKRIIKNGTLSWEHCNEFSVRLLSYLERNVELLSNPGRVRGVIEFSPEACRRWISVYNAIEVEIKEGGRFFGMGDHASKLAENISRVAALLHVYEYGEGEISKETLDYAIKFCFWCSDQFREVFMAPTQLEVDVNKLREWFDEHWEMGYDYFPKTKLYQYAPKGIRTKSRLEPVLDYMRENGEIDFIHQGRLFCVELCSRSRANVTLPKSYFDGIGRDSSRRRRFL